MRIVTWNVARRSSRLAEQAAALAGREPDVVALQEVTARTLGLWRAALATIGLPHVLASLDTADPRRAPASRRVTGVLIAASGPLHPAATAPAVPWAETALGATADSDAGPVEIHCVHVPNASNGEVKVRTLQAIRRALQQAPAAARVMCGDLNTPRRELPDGTVLSFARDTRGRLRPERGVEWDEVELGVVPGLRDLGYSDAFRSLHGYHAGEPSWTWQRISGHGGGWRLDHLFTSPTLHATASCYHHQWREDGLSDHSALEADLVAARSDPASATRGLARRPVLAVSRAPRKSTGPTGRKRSHRPSSE